MKPGSPTTRDLTSSGAGLQARQTAVALAGPTAFNWQVPVVRRLQQWTPATRLLCYPREPHPQGEQAPCREGPCLPFLRNIPVTPVVRNIGENTGYRAPYFSPQSVTLTPAAGPAERVRQSLVIQSREQWAEG